MDPVIAPSAQLYAITSSRFDKALEGLTDRDVRKRITNDSNPMIWIVGHMTTTGCSLLAMLGRKIEHPWGDQFGRGSTVDDETEFPPLADLVSKWREAGEALQQQLEELTDEELSADAPRDFPVEDKTIRGVINFLAYHEVYHFGQVALLKKCLGQGSLVG